MPDNQSKELDGQKGDLSDKLSLLHNWRDLSLEHKINYVKGSYGGFNLGREDIERLPDNYREMRYELKTIRMVVEIIDIQSNQLEKLDIENLRLNKQLTTTQQALDSAVEALKAIAKNDHGLFYKADYQALMHRGIKIAEAALDSIEE